MTDLSPRQKREMAEAWGVALKRLRARAGKSQNEAAELLDIEQGSYSKYEKGERQSLLNPNLRRRISLAFGFEDDALDNEFIGSKPEATNVPASPFAARSPLVYPLIGRVRAGVKGQQIFDEVDAGEYDFGRILDRYTQLVRVTGESMVPILEPGAIVAIDTNGYPKKNCLAVIVLEDGSYLVKKFVRMTETTVECIEMEALEFNGRTVYAERPLAFPVVEVRAIFPATLRIE